MPNVDASEQIRSPSLAVVVPATDRPPTLGRCLAAVRVGSDPADEIVVVAEPAGAGPATARNLGVARTEADVIAFVDADVEVEPDALARLRRAFAESPQLDALFGSYDQRPEAPGAVSRFRNLRHHHVHTSSPGAAETFWAGLGAVRREPFVRVGGFDERRFEWASIEDIELGMRLHRGGARIRLDPSVRGRHLKRWTLASMVRTDLTRRGIPWVRLQLEQRRATRALNLSWPRRLAALAALAAAAGAIARRPRAAASATIALVVLEAPFLALLRQAGGMRLAVAGVPLLLVHHLVSVLAVPAGIAAHGLAAARAAARR